MSGNEKKVLLDALRFAFSIWKVALLDRRWLDTVYGLLEEDSVVVEV
jgi:hypothetical protein